MANPTTNLPMISIRTLILKAIANEPITKIKSANKIVLFLPYLSEKKLENKQPIKAPNRAILTTVSFTVSLSWPKSSYI